MNTKTAGLLVIALIVAIGLGIFAYSNKTTKTPTSTPKTSEVRQTSVTYKDGIYKQLGSYTSPAGPEEVDVTLTIKDGIITESEVIPMAEHPISKSKQEGFAKEYKTSVVGKSIKDLQLGKIAGASLTPKGFNEAVEKIKAQAKSV